MSESSEQKALIKWCEYSKVPIFHIPNGGTRNPKEAAELKRQGVKPGVPDLFIPLPRGSKHGMFIEMKYGKNKTLVQIAGEINYTEQYVRKLHYKAINEVQEILNKKEEQ